MQPTLQIWDTYAYAKNVLKLAFKFIMKYIHHLDNKFRLILG